MFIDFHVPSNHSTLVYMLGLDLGMFNCFFPLYNIHDRGKPISIDNFIIQSRQSNIWYEEFVRQYTK